MVYKGVLSNEEYTMPTSRKITPVKHPTKGKNRFCGPAAISILTGADTGQAAALLRQVSGKRSIMGTHSHHIHAALRKLGYNVGGVRLYPDREQRPTLAAWLRETKSSRGGTTYLIAAGNHWQVVQGRRYCCGLTGEVVSIRDERRARVSEVYEIARVTSIKIEEVAPAVRRPKDTEAPARRKAKALAARHDIEIEVERWSGYSRIIVWGPKWADGYDSKDVDPYTGDHYAEDWADALERVESYASLIADEPHLVRARRELA